jgi:hypothetical protein
MGQRLSFDDWMVQVTRVMVKSCGMGPDDLPDYNYRDCYDAGYSAFECAQEAIDAAKDY